jgi:hypothetical protein
MAFSQNVLVGIGLQVCVGTLILAAVLYLAARAFNKQRRSNQKNQNMRTDPGSNLPSAEDGVDFKLDDDFGGVPTTGSVQEYERDAGDEDIIGSSGFENRPHDPGDHPDAPPPDENPRYEA